MIFAEVDLVVFLLGVPSVIFDVIDFVALLVLWWLFGGAVVLSFFLEFLFQREDIWISFLVHMLGECFFL
jgi:hypothetical protein